MTATTVPLLPCLDPDGTVEFYQALGFSIGHRQDRPYLYLVLKLEDIEMHLKDAPSTLDPAEENSGGFLVFVDDAAPFHARFVEGLQRCYGRVPVAGLPRITRLRPGQSRFCLYDPSGNCVIVINRDEPEIEYGGSSALSGLAKAHDNARIFRDFKNDDVLAARTLDAALRRHGGEASRLDVARALADRAELAVVLDDDTATARRGELATLDLTAEERAQLGPELTALEQIERWVR